jgi:branched-chain amino acid transport system permease protein
MEYARHLLLFFEAYFLAALGLNLLIGQSGLLSLAHAGYFAVGGYAYAIAVVRLEAPMWLAVLVAAPIAVALSTVLWILSWRLRDDAWVLGSIAVQCLFFSAMNNWTDSISPVGSWRNLTNGPYGISVVGNLSHQFGSSYWQMVVTSSSITILCTGIYRLMLDSPWSRVLRASRDDEAVARSLGHSTLKLKFQVLAVGCGLVAVGGALNAAYIGYVHPNLASLDSSILMLCMVLVGGTGTAIRSPLIGATVLLLIPEALRLVHLPEMAAGSIRLMVYGGALVALMHWRQRGLAGKCGLDGA